MEFPVWFVDYLTAPMLIPTVAIPHVIVAQFAVGGGIVLADMVRRCYRENLPDTLEFLRTASRYFVLITVVFGAVTGVGIWWTIGLTSPDATAVLIQQFSFFWATEWVMFLVEIVAAFVFYYMWDELTPSEHVTVGWIYAGSAWLSLVLITGIVSFMLTTGSWEPRGSPWSAFLNPSFVPQTLIRTGGSLAIAALTLGFFVSFSERLDLKNRIITWVSRWAMFGMLLIAVGAVLYFYVLPRHVRLNLIRAPILIVMVALNFSITLVVLGALASGAINGTRWITPPAAALLLLAGAGAIASGEFVREGSRKPYLIQDFMYSPGLRVSEVGESRERGFVRHATWLKKYVSKKYPQFLEGGPTALSPGEQVAVGKSIFRYHCASCHATVGYNGIEPIIEPWSRSMLLDTTRNLHRANPAMPPWFGNDAERKMLGQYLLDLKRRWSLGRYPDDSHT